MATAKIDNDNFKSKHTYSFEKFLTVLQDSFTILNKNFETGNQMVGRIPNKIIVPDNPEMDSCKHIFSNTHGQNFANAVAYLSGQVNKIFTNEKIKNKNKR